MPVRSNGYDTLGTTVAKLKKKHAEHKDELVKAIREGDLHSMGEVLSEMDVLAKSTFESFSMLKSDYDRGRITLSRYLPHLKNLKSLLTDVDEKITNPHLKAHLIAGEIERYIG